MKRQALSIDRIAERQYEPLFRYCLKRAQGDEQLARECAAEALLRAQKLGDPPEHPNVNGWLRKTAANVLHEKLRERKAYYKRNVSLEQIMADPSRQGSLAPFFEREYGFLSDLWSENGAPFEGLDDEAVYRIKEEILLDLPEGERQLIRMAYDQKLTLAQMSERLGKSKDAIRVKLSRLTDKVTRMVYKRFEEEE